MGTTKDTLDPKGGQIIRDPNGEPTGILRNTAMGTSEYGKFIKQILSPKIHKKLINKALTLYRADCLPCYWGQSRNCKCC